MIPMNPLKVAGSLEHSESVDYDVPSVAYRSIPHRLSDDSNKAWQNLDRKIPACNRKIVRLFRGIGLFSVDRFLKFVDRLSIDSPVGKTFHPAIILACTSIENR